MDAAVSPSSQKSGSKMTDSAVFDGSVDEPLAHSVRSRMLNPQTRSLSGFVVIGREAKAENRSVKGM
jgi:hypothetical protein